jgi:hypothetical protein
MKAPAVFLAAIVTVVAFALPARATSYVARHDLEIVARDARTGQQIWRHVPPKLSDVQKWLLPGGLFVSSYDGPDKHLFLDPKTGQPIPPFDWQRQLSAVGEREKLVLSNGWTLHDFHRGSSRTLDFFDGKSRMPVWSVATATYPHEVVAWQDHVIWARGYLSDDGIVCAYQAGAAKPAWTVDLNDLVEAGPRALTRMKLFLHGNTLFVQSQEQIFGFHPRNGALRFRYDLATDLGLKFRPDFWRGGVPDAQLRFAGDVLLIAYECRVVAIDMKAQRYLWHLAPDVFPSDPGPVVGDGGAVYMLAGPQDRLFPLAQPVVDRGAAEWPLWPLALLSAVIAILIWWIARRSPRAARSAAAPITSS